MPEPDPTSTSKDPSTEETKYSLNLGKGKMKEVSLAEMKTMAEKEGGADAKFRDADEMLKTGQAKEVKAADALEAMELHQKVQGNFATDTEKNRYCDLFDTDAEYRKILLQGPQSADESQLTQESSGVKPSSPVTLEDLSPELQVAMKGAAAVTAKNETDGMLEEINKSIDTSDLFVTILKNVDSGNVDNVKSLASDQIRNGLAVRMRQGQRYGPQLVQETVKSVAEAMQKLGGYLQPAEKPGPTPLGFGSAAASLDTQLPNGKAPERVAGDDPKYAENWHQRIVHAVMHPGQKKTSV